MSADFTLIAQARASHLSAADLERIVPVLDALEAAFRPLVTQIRHETEPATVLSDAAVVGGK